MARTGPEDLDRQLGFHRREWHIQRIGWVLVAIFLVLAFGGAFGGGPLSHTHADGAAGRIEYERFVRNGLSTELVVTAVAARGVSRVAISTDYLDAFRIERITPEPLASRTAGKQVVFEFAAASPGASISFSLHPQRLWRHTGAVTIDGGAPLAISQLTYP